VRDIRRDSGGRARDDFKGVHFQLFAVPILIILSDNRSRFVPRDSRFDEGRNRFAEGRRDHSERDLREPQKWEHDMSTHIVYRFVDVVV
jgi:hypothetical protein